MLKMKVKLSIMTRFNKSKVLTSEVIKRKQSLLLFSSDEKFQTISFTNMLNLTLVEKNTRNRSQLSILEVRSRKSTSKYFMNSQIVVVRKKRYQK